MTASLMTCCTPATIAVARATRGPLLFLNSSRRRTLLRVSSKKDSDIVDPSGGLSSPSINPAGQQWPAGKDVQPRRFWDPSMPGPVQAWVERSEDQISTDETEFDDLQVGAETLSWPCVCAFGFHARC